MNKKEKNVNVSIIIPTKNGSCTIEKCLCAIKTQKTDKTCEIIAIDSGSSDDTVNILEKYNCKIVRISPSDFTHGYSRNLGAQIAQGQILIFINQDAIPKDIFWMEELISPIKNSTVATFSKQIPYEKTPTAEKVFLSYIYPDIPREIGKESLKKRSIRESVLFSTVSGAIKKDIFSKYKFSNVTITTEDQELIVRLIKSGYTVKYVPKSIVTHSHSYTLSQVFGKYFDSGLSLYSIPDLHKFSLGKTISEEWKLFCESLKESSSEGFGSCVFTIAYIFAKSTGFILGTKAKSFPKPIRRIFSLTIKRKKE